MKRCLLRNGCLAALSIVFTLAGNGVATATGYWNLPGNMCQWCGCGGSGGYHAPYVLGPHTGGCFAMWNEVRMPYAPNPYGCAPYCGHGGTQGGEMQLNPPMIMSPSEQIPPPQEQVVPEATRRPLIFQAPVQY